MKHYIGRRKYKIYAFDLESHNDLESIAKKETSMWLATLIDENSKIDDENSYYYDMDSVLSKIEELSTPHRKHGESAPIKNVCIYIYNLSFEWSFMLPVMLERGFTFKEKIYNTDEFVYNSVSTKSVSSVWSVEMKFGKKSGRVLLKDLAKIYGGGLGNVAKAFNLPTQKGEIDYRLNRLHNYTPTKEEKEYCFKDTRIIIDILLQMQDKKDRAFWNVSSMASYSMKKLLGRGFPRKTKPYSAYREDYPELDKEESEFLRKSVGGGITYAPRRYQFKEIKEQVGHIDAHSMHPSQAYYHLFPYGKGEYFEGKPTNTGNYINCCRILISYDDVKLHSIIKLIGIEFVDSKELVVWDFEIPTIKKCYINCRITYIDGYRYKFKPLPWRKYYSDCYNKRLKAKREGDAFNVLFNKLLINSSYGKHLENAHNQIFKNTIREDGIIDSDVEDKKDEDIRVNAKYTYLPVGSCIPAYSRVCLIETALKIGWEYITYFDTDSIFFIWNEHTKKVWEEQIDKRDFLGGWGFEELIDKSQFICAKRYKTETDGKTTIKAGGINFGEYRKQLAESHGENPDKYMIPFDEINLVNNTFKVQRAYRVKGGTIIEFQDKEVSVQKKFEAIYKKNVGEV